MYKYELCTLLENNAMFQFLLPTLYMYIHALHGYLVLVGVAYSGCLRCW